MTGLRAWLGAGCAAAALAAPAVAMAAAVDLFYERTVMTAADARCGLFEPPVGAALAAAQAQARGAALRSGVEAADLKLIEQRAKGKAAGAGCASKDMSLAAGRVRDAFEGYARLIRMTYPGEMAGWKADRSTSRDTPLWRLSQTVRFGGDEMVFGIAGRSAPGVLLAAAGFEGDQAPYAARLVLRDASRTARPYLNRRMAGADGKIPLAHRTPPRAMSEVFVAEARARAAEALLPEGAEQGWSFRFPEAAAQALAGLDPREAAVVEFVFAGRSGDTVRRAYIEVGDFAAGRAFLQTAQR